MKRYLAFTALAALLGAACSSTTDSTTTTAVEETTTSTSIATTTTAAPVESTTTTTMGGTPIVPVVPGEDADADAIVDAYAVVFDSSTTYADKAPFIVDPTGLEGTVEAYMNAGDGVGGIFLEVTGVGVDGDVAAVGYDLLFAGNPFQTDQIGDAVRGGTGWQVTREFFCSVMQLARVGCP